MKWEPYKKVKWPSGLPKSYFSEPGQASPDWGATSALFVSLIRAVESLEQRVDNLEKQVSELQMWP